MTLVAFRCSLLLVRIVLVILIAVGLSSCQSVEESIDFATVPDRSLVRVQVGERELTVEVVNSPESITQGLSGRSEIGSDGMLFVLPERAIARFWMKEMLFPLDMVWIDGDVIVGITPDVPIPAPGSTTTSLPIFPSPQRVTSVLEVPAGVAADYGWSVGNGIQAIKLAE